jgi:type IV pilus assembly protein PilW
MKSAPERQRFLNGQIGFSLIELMVAMVIGCFLILGVTQIFISNQKTYLFQQGQVGNQENGRFAVALLGQELSKAGYRSNPIRVFPAQTTQGCAFPERASVLAVSSTSVCIRYQATNRTDVNCQGSPLAAGDQASISVPYALITNPVIVELIAFDAATSSITCTTGGSTVPLVSGVRDVRFEFGAGPVASKTVTAFSTAPAGTINAVRYTVLMQSPGSAGLRDTTAASPALAEWNSRYSTTYSDTTNIFQIVQSTTMIRNQMP